MCACQVVVQFKNSLLSTQLCVFVLKRSFIKLRMCNIKIYSDNVDCLLYCLQCFTVLVEQQEEHWCCKSCVCWYAGNDLLGTNVDDLHVFRLSLMPPPSLVLTYLTKNSLQTVTTVDLH